MIKFLSIHLNFVFIRNRKKFFFFYLEFLFAGKIDICNASKNFIGASLQLREEFFLAFWSQRRQRAHKSYRSVGELREAFFLREQ